MCGISGMTLIGYRVFRGCLRAFQDTWVFKLLGVGAFEVAQCYVSFLSCGGCGVGIRIWRRL